MLRPPVDWPGTPMGSAAWRRRRRPDPGRPGCCRRSAAPPAPPRYRRAANRRARSAGGARGRSRAAAGGRRTRPRPSTRGTRVALGVDDTRGRSRGPAQISAAGGLRSKPDSLTDVVGRQRCRVCVKTQRRRRLRERGTCGMTPGRQRQRRGSRPSVADLARCRACRCRARCVRRRVEREQRVGRRERRGTMCRLTPRRSASRAPPAARVPSRAGKCAREQVEQLRVVDDAGRSRS